MPKLGMEPIRKAALVKATIVEIGRTGSLDVTVSQVVDYGRKKGDKKGRKKGAGQSGGDRRIHVVNLCFEAKALSTGLATTPEETLEIGFFDLRALPEPLVPIQRIRIEDGIAGREAAAVR